MDVDVLGRVKGLFLDVGQATRLPHKDDAEEEADERDDSVDPDRAMHLKPTVNHEFKCERDDREVHELGGD